MDPIGQLKEIYRYPVKSFQGESINTSIIESYGLRGDRSAVFIDHIHAGRHLSAKQVPLLLGYSARFINNVSNTNDPQIEIKSPYNKYYHWDDELLNEVEHLSNRKLSLRKYPLIDNGPLAVDDANILLTTDASLVGLEKMIGEPVDFRRFRPNFVINAFEQQPYQEFEWLGHTIKIGEVELEVYKKCQRCSMINVNPDNLNFDLSYLKQVGKHLDACFGVYARVIKTGTVETSEKIYLIH